jgi:hypothetical protein
MQQSLRWKPLQSLPSVGSFYEHRNGLIYKVVALARDQDREEILVIHEGADGVTWSRTVGNFMGLNSEGSARFRVTDGGWHND